MSQREYAEDTAFWSIKCATAFSARRRTVHLFFAEAEDGADSNDAESGRQENAYLFVDNTPGVFSDLQSLLEKRNPETKAMNTDPDLAFAGGLHVGLYNELQDHLHPNCSSRFTSVHLLPVEYIATMPASQLSWYHRLQETTRALISTTFSSAVIEPGVTTTTEVEWWLREKVQALNYSTWFQPDVTIVTPSEDFGSILPTVSCSGG
jgi:hypothetical protein